MKFRTKAGALAAAASAASEGLARKAETIPILGFIRIEVKDGMARLAATNLEEQITVPLAVEAERDGSICVPGKQFVRSIAAMAKDGVLELEAGPAGDVVTAKCGRSRLRLPVMPAADFPDLRPGDGGVRFVIGFDHLIATLGKVAFAISDEETRYYLNGVSWSLEDGLLWSVATNGHQLGAMSIEPPSGIEGMPNVILPKDLVRRLVKMSGKGDATVSVTDRAIMVTLPDGAEMVSKLIDGNFPDWRRVVPAPADPVMTINAAALEEAAVRVATVCTDKSRGLRLELERDVLRLSARGDMGSAEMIEEVPCSYAGDPITLGFNTRYLLGHLASAEEEDLRFHMVGATAPILIDSGNADARFVLMPMRA